MDSENTISLDKYREALTKLGLELIRTSNGHEVWVRKDLLRPVVFSVQFDNVPIMQVLSNCRTMGIEFEEMFGSETNGDEQR